MIATPVSREALLHVVKNLPAAPQILAQLGHLLLEPNSDLGEIIELLKRDSGLTARVIRVSNSTVYGGGDVRVGSLEEALARVGFNEVYRLTGFAAVAQVGDHTLNYYNLAGGQFRENSLLTGLIMEALAPSANLDARTAYTAGLLRSTGKIAIDRLASGPTYAMSYNARGKNGPLADWEMDLIGTDNCAAAATILEAWSFPRETVAAVREHYRPSSQSPAMAHVLNLAAGAAERAGHGLPGEKSYWVPTPTRFAFAGIDEATLRNASLRALEKFGPVRAAVA